MSPSPARTAGEPDGDVALTAPHFDAVILAGGGAARLGGLDKPGLVVGPASLAATAAAAAAHAGARRVILVGPERPGVAELTAAAGGSLIVTREDPPGAGPVPALRAGLALARAPWIMLLAADLPFLLPRHLRALLTTARQQPASAPGRAWTPEKQAEVPGEQAGEAGERSAAPGGERPGAAAHAPLAMAAHATAAVPGGERPDAANRAGAVLVDDENRPQWLASCWRTAALRAALAQYAGSSLRGLLGPLEPAGLRYAAEDGTPPPWLDCDTPADLSAARAWAKRGSALPADDDAAGR